MSPSDELTVMLLDREFPEQNPIQGWDQSLQPTWLGEVVVRFDPDQRGSGDCTAVSVRLAGGTSAKALSALPWRRILKAAVAHYEAAHENSIESWQRAVAAARGVRRSRGRPRLGDSHYGIIATRYLDFVRAGESAPIKKIAEERGVSRNTAAAWVRRARQQGYLPVHTPPTTS